MSTTPSVSPQPPAGGPPAAPPAKSGIGKVILWIVGIFAGLFVLVIIAVAAIGFFVVHKAKQAGLDPDLMRKNPVLAMAKLSVAGNPDTEMVSSDDSSGTIVVRDKKTGKVSTMKVDPDSKTMTVTDENGKTVTMKLDPSNNRLVVTDDTGKTASMQVDPSKNSLVVTDAQGKTATITADAQAGNVEIKGPDGTLKMGANADKVPSWVPMYPGIKPQNNFSARANGQQTGNYSFVTKDAVDKVLGYYDSSLKSAGFKTSTTTNNTNGKISGGVNGTADNDKRTVLVVAGDSADGTMVNVTFNSKP
jgi:hypothetical protein